jgi:hypothetical protein
MSKEFLRSKESQKRKEPGWDHLADLHLVQYAQVRGEGAESWNNYIGRDRFDGRTDGHERVLHLISSGAYDVLKAYTKTVIRIDARRWKAAESAFAAYREKLGLPPMTDGTDLAEAMEGWFW